MVAWDSQVSSGNYCQKPHLLQLCQQRLRFHEIRGVKALSEPAVDRLQQLVGLLAFALLLPQAREGS